ncbi:hypothetical protein DEO72_LG3g1181 [Vigna unguiculata]|uniref:Uncharacterized protein n=1 Tax=Vigna unguiculata TaxID=3917 RepID=A0A4D6LDJ5_VIGUN|nr:hypothetical protein DEO72_LG3g1181 [Vigna unguiculata]
MTQHLPIQVLASQLKRNTYTTQSLQDFRPAQLQVPPSETSPDRLAVPSHRQALAFSQTHYFTVTAWRSTPCRQAPRDAGTFDASPITWRTCLGRQVPYQ